MVAKPALKGRVKLHEFATADWVIRTIWFLNEKQELIDWLNLRGGQLELSIMPEKGRLNRVLRIYFQVEKGRIKVIRQLRLDEETDACCRAMARYSTCRDIVKGRISFESALESGLILFSE